MNYRAVRAIVRRDLQRVIRSKGVMLPLIIVPILFMVLIPALVGIFAPVLSEMPGSTMSDIPAYLESMPGGLRQQLAGYSEIQQMIILFLVYMFAPLYLVLPLMVSTVIAADSFAGEKERKTLEALLHTPTTDLELVAGKLLSAWLPAVSVALVGAVLYAITANLAAWSIMQEIFLPTSMWLALVLWVAPAAAGLGLAGTVLVSSRVGTFQEANQIAGAVVLPLVMLVVAQATGVMYFSVGLVLLLGLLFWALDALLLWFGVRTFQRQEIIAQL
ncbi:MAG: ABC transporter permease subunit [Anaerolineales bacterium]